MVSSSTAPPSSVPGHSLSYPQQLPGISLDAKGISSTTTTTSSSSSSSSTKPTQKVFGFLRKRSGVSQTGRDRSKSMVVPSSVEFGGPRLGSSVDPVEPHPIQNMNRRKSLDLNRLNDHAQDLDRVRPSLASTRVGSVDLARSGSSSGTPTLSGRRSTFSLSLPWRPQSEYAVGSSSPGVCKLTKSQRRFMRAFPELADLVMVPPAYCAPCLATPPQTPPESSLSPSNTLTTLTSSDFSSTSTLACLGHFNDFACALEREILWQGTLYVTATHICFYGKHFGKTVRVMVDYRDLVSIDREKKMGVFPSSLRIRVKAPPPCSTTATTDSATTSSGSGSDQDTKEGTSPSAGDATKDYVLTSLISREQAYLDIERNWRVHRQVMRNLSDTGLDQQQLQDDNPSDRLLQGVSRALEKDGSGVFTMDPEVCARISTMRERRMAPRTYSVISDEAFSSTENVDRPPLHERFSSARTMVPSPMCNEPIGDSVWSGRSSAEEVLTRKVSGSSSESRRGSVTSATSSEKQESAGLIGFLQRRQSQLKRNKKAASPTPVQQEESLEQQEIITQTMGDFDPNEATNNYSLDSQDISQSQSNPQIILTKTVAAPIAIHSSPSSASIKSEGTFKSSTPPPFLISPSLTTTKVSHSSSTIQSSARPGATPGMTVHIRKESQGGAFDTPSDEIESGHGSQTGSTCTFSTTTSSSAVSDTAAATALPTPPPAPLPAGPVSCGCARHYKNAVLSTIVPLPVDLCFEILFSAQGAGLGDKLGCDTHRIKDGSTEVKIMPWQKDGSASVTASKDGACWEKQTRQLEYSVAFKIPMMAKTSTACFETQQVTLYEDHMILVHSESRTPSVPYGEHFSTVNQICMTWDSPGKTRIKCFTEVKFKKSILWSGKVEAGSLEGSGGFYKEFIRQLVDVAETRGNDLVLAHQQSIQAKALAAVKTPPTTVDSNNGSTCSAFIPTTAATPGSRHPRVMSSDGISLLSHPSTASSSNGFQPSTSSLSSSEPVEMSRAQSLLSQQFQRHNSHAVKGSSARLSLDTARPILESALAATQPGPSPLSQESTADKKSAVTSFLQALAPSMSLAESHSATAKSEGDQGQAQEVATKAATPASLLWSELLRKGAALFNKAPPSTITADGKTSTDSESSSTPSSKASATANAPAGSEEGKTTVPGSAMRPTPMDRNLSGTRVTFASDTASSSSSPMRSSDLRSSFSSTSSTQQLSSSRSSLGSLPQVPAPRLFSKTIFFFVVLGMAVSALNVWHLFNIVSSVVEVVQWKQDLLSHQHYHQHPMSHLASLKDQEPHGGVAHLRHPRHEPHRAAAGALASSAFPPSPTGWDSVQRVASHSIEPLQHHSDSGSEFAEIHGDVMEEEGDGDDEEHEEHERAATAAVTSRLDPLRVEKDRLREEIVELFHLLELARKEVRHGRQE